MFKDLKAAKQQAKVNQVKSTEDYETVLKEAIELYEQFTTYPDDNTLRKSAGKFYECLTLKRGQMEPYLFLSMIFFIFEEEEKAKKYFSAALELSDEKPEYSEFLREVKQVLYQS